MSVAERVIVTLTVWAEARGDGLAGMAAVAHVIKTRAEIGGWWGDSPGVVCLHPYQFSCWNTKDPNRVAAVRDAAAEGPSWRLAELAVKRVFKGWEEPVPGATHYYNPAAASPDWAQGRAPDYVVGRHHFFKGDA